MPTVERGEPFPPGYCHFPQLGEEFFRQLTAEQLITRIVKGYRKSEWQKARERNEALDIRIYARAAVSQFGMDRFAEQHWTALEKQMGITAKPAPTQPQVAIRLRDPLDKTSIVMNARLIRSIGWTRSHAGSAIAKAGLIDDDVGHCSSRNYNIEFRPRGR